jgi:MOSC domain-containing protein
MANEIGRVASLWRFPVKSLRGEQLSALEIGPTGVIGDRAYALRDTKTGRIMSGKR